MNVGIFLTEVNSERDVYKRQGITDMEKLMGRKIFKELLGDYIIKPKGRLTLVPETDKREEVHTLGEFRKEF